MWRVPARCDPLASDIPSLSGWDIDMQQLLAEVVSDKLNV